MAIGAVRYQSRCDPAKYPDTVLRPRRTPQMAQRPHCRGSSSVDCRAWPLFVSHTTAHHALQNGNLPPERRIILGFGLDGSPSGLRQKKSSAITVASRYAIPSPDQYGQDFRCTRGRLGLSLDDLLSKPYPRIGCYTKGQCNRLGRGITFWIRPVSPGTLFGQPRLHRIEP
jgi:hypothetical protein